MATNYSNPVLRERGNVETISAARTLTAADSGKTFLLDAAAGAAVTLPDANGEEGLWFKFVVASTFATTDWTIESAEGDNINGIIADLGNTVAGVPAAGEDQINFVATAETVGDWIEIYNDADNDQWLVNGQCAANGGITATDPA